MGQDERSPRASVRTGPLQHLVRSVVLGAMAMAALSGAQAGTGAGPVVAVAEFDSVDTSGESGERAAAHSDLVRTFSGRLQTQLAADGATRVVPLTCGEKECTARSMTPEAFKDLARSMGADIVVYGSIQKMSTLVQFGTIHALDLRSDTQLFAQAISFRGDNALAFDRAAAFVVRHLKEAQAN